jgi:uncharacterized repeat protein (TIGR03806 family)
MVRTRVNRFSLIAAVAGAFAAVAAACADTGAPAEGPAPAYGITAYHGPRAWLRMPHGSDRGAPPLLSQTGVFTDLRTLTPAPGLIPYDLIVPFWSDGATKQRYMAVPKGTRIGFKPDGEWSFPAGTVFVKTFELATDEARPQVRRRLETRLLVRDDHGGVYGVVYKWRADLSDADLLTASQTEEVAIHTRDGGTRRQSWYYPSRENCLTCHNVRAGGVLGPKTRQLNRLMTYPSGVDDNELRALNHLRLLSPAVSDAQLRALPALAASADDSRSLEDRARSYLDANCAHCHRPGGTVANFDARYDTPLDRQQLVDGPILISQGIDRPRVIAPHDIWRSILYMRVATNGDIRMPPLARQTIDEHGVQLLRAWIESMPGRDVLVPPKITPDGGTYEAAVLVTMSSPDPGAQIRYTLDGSVPGPQDLEYSGPIRVAGSTVVRARAYKDGMTRSITTESVFIVGQQ